MACALARSRTKGERLPRYLRVSSSSRSVVDEPFGQLLKELFARLTLAVLDLDPPGGGHKTLGSEGFLRQAKLAAQGFEAFS